VFLTCGQDADGTVSCKHCLQAGCFSSCPTYSIKALKERYTIQSIINKSIPGFQIFQVCGHPEIATDSSNLQQGTEAVGITVLTPGE